jgi:hypothetical protein
MYVNGNQGQISVFREFDLNVVLQARIVNTNFKKYFWPVFWNKDKTEWQNSTSCGSHRLRSRPSTVFFREKIERDICERENTKNVKMLWFFCRQSFLLLLLPPISTVTKKSTPPPNAFSVEPGFCFVNMLLYWFFPSGRVDRHAPFWSRHAPPSLFARTELTFKPP